MKQRQCTAVTGAVISAGIAIALVTTGVTPSFAIGAASAPAASSSSTAAPAWSSSAIYVGGNKVTRGGNIYVAGWWTTGDDPLLMSGPAGSGKVWQLVGADTSTPAPTETPAPTASPEPPTATAPPVDPSSPKTTGQAPAVVASAYKDVTVNMDWAAGQLRTSVNGTLVPLVGPNSWAAQSGNKAVTLAFATGSADSPNWAGVPNEQIEKSVAALASANVNYIISTGGAAGEFTSKSGASLESFIARYASSNLVGIDFDIESGQSFADIGNLVNSAAAAAKTYPKLRFSFTLATLGSSDGSQGSVTPAGVETIRALKQSGLSNYTINLMAMDYGPATPANVVVKDGKADMAGTAIQAALNVQSKFGVPLSKIELTLMIGVNDVTDEVTSVADLKTVADYVNQNKLAGLHLWSLDRDTPSAVGTVTANGSGTATAALAYVKVLNDVR